MRGLVKAEDPETKIQVFNTNTQTRALVTVQLGQSELWNFLLTGWGRGGGGDLILSDRLSVLPRQTPGGELSFAGSAAIDGVPGTGEPWLQR